VSGSTHRIPLLISLALRIAFPVILIYYEITIKIRDKLPREFRLARCVRRGGDFFFDVPSGSTEMDACHLPRPDHVVKG
jgi:hypothetical protein